MMGEFLKTAREKAGLSQLDVSKKLGYTSPQFVSNWERDLVKLPLSTWPKVASMYKIPKQEAISMLVQIEKQRIESAFR